MEKLTFINIIFISLFMLSGCQSRAVHCVSSHPVPDFYDTALPVEKGSVDWGISEIRYP